MTAAPDLRALTDAQLADLTADLKEKDALFYRTCVSHALTQTQQAVWISTYTALKAVLAEAQRRRNETL